MAANYSDEEEDDILHIGKQTRWPLKDQKVVVIQT
jgi:hypothetical protein